MVRLAKIAHVSSAFGFLMYDLLVLRPDLAVAVGAFEVGVISRSVTNTSIGQRALQVVSRHLQEVHVCSSKSVHMSSYLILYIHMGRRWSLYTVAPVQFCVCFGAVIGCTVLGGQSMKFIYSIYHRDGSLKLHDFIIFFGLMMLLLSQMPSFHSLRYINLLSLLMCLGYSACAVGGSIYAGHHHPTNKDYSLRGGKVSKMFGVFNSFAIIATTYGNGIIPEIQATLAPPVAGKMFKGLCVCYTVVASTFFSVAVSGYWAFGNESSGNLLSNLAPLDEPALVPNWLIILANMLVLLQLLAVAMVYSQPTFEVLEGKASDAKEGRFSARNLLPRLVLRGSFVAITTFISAMLPFFGDINALIGAFGFLPLDFIFPMIFYNIVFQPSRRSVAFWFNTLIAFAFVLVCIIGCIAAVRQIVLDANNYKLFANL
ncbi:hypothetical protein L7F22_057809 [Adiantum nelumboides]|nr:hypothetical protein [Adiantum nelumboides]